MLRGPQSSQGIDQTWGTDLTYFPLQKGFLCLVANVVLFSRYIPSWKLSNRVDTVFCLEALEMVLAVVISPRYSICIRAVNHFNCIRGAFQSRRD